MRTKSSPINPQSGAPLAPRDQPGYYPGFSTLAQQAYWDDATRKLVLDRVAKTGEIRFFTPEEASTLLAVVERIIPQEDRTAHRTIPLLPVIDERLFTNRIEGYRYEDMPSDQDCYRLAAHAFDHMAQTLHGRSFHLLGTLEQEEILQSIHDGKPKAANEIWQQMNVKRFWTLLVTDCSTAYYSHPWAWDEIGFGGPAYPRGYMRLEEGEPEPWEVNEKRYDWNPPSDTLSGDQEKSKPDVSLGSHPGQGGTH